MHLLQKYIKDKKRCGKKKEAPRNLIGNTVSFFDYVDEYNLD